MVEAGEGSPDVKAVAEEQVFSHPHKNLFSSRPMRNFCSQNWHEKKGVGANGYDGQPGTVPRGDVYDVGIFIPTYFSFFHGDEHRQVF